MEIRYEFDIHDFDQCTLALVIKHTPCLSSFIKVKIKVPSSTTKTMADYSDKFHSEVSSDENFRK